MLTRVRKETMKCLNLLPFALFLACALAAAAPGGSDKSAALIEKCNDDFNKVVACIGYATGKAEAPTKQCCGSVEEIKSKDPVCLCFFMEQTLNGSETIKSMGIHADRLLQLPSACKLTNASISYCPKLLNIPPSSPEYKIFTNISSASSSSPPTTTATGASLPLTSTKSSGPKFRPQISAPIWIIVTIFSYASWSWA